LKENVFRQKMGKNRFHHPPNSDADFYYFAVSGTDKIKKFSVTNLAIFKIEICCHWQKFWRQVIIEKPWKKLEREKSKK